MHTEIILHVPQLCNSPEEEALIELNEWVISKGLSESELPFELSDPESGQPSAVLGVTWPDGLQPGLNNPSLC